MTQNAATPHHRHSVPTRPLRFAMLGAGFWAHFQLAAWQEVAGAQCVAVCDQKLDKAQRLAAEFHIPRATDLADELFADEALDFVDIVTNPNTHGSLVRMAAWHQVPAICQKPLAPTFAEAEGIAAACRDAGVPLLVHENWRWQRPIREVRRVLDAGTIGQPFRARIDMISGFPVFQNQPSLKELDQFILTDMGTHILDVARFLFGEAESLYCQTQRAHSDIRGEDVATVVTRHRSSDDVSTVVTSNMAYAENYLEVDCFPQTLIFVEGTAGSIDLAPDYWVNTTTSQGTDAQRHPPQMYPWVDPAYAIVQSSMVDCHRDLLHALSVPSHIAETTADDNLKTLRLVFDAYRSAEENLAVNYKLR